MPPKAAIKGGKKAVKSTKAVNKDKKRKKSRKETYSVYIYRVLKQVRVGHFINYFTLFGPS